MHFNIEFATMLEFSTRGTNDTALKSRQICGNIKVGNSRVIERLIEIIKELPDDHPINLMFQDEPVLVPIPRSTPLVDGALWLSKILGDHFVASGLGNRVENLIHRKYKVPRPSSYFSLL